MRFHLTEIIRKLWISTVVVGCLSFVCASPSYSFRLSAVVSDAYEGASCKFVTSATDIASIADSAVVYTTTGNVRATSLMLDFVNTGTVGLVIEFYKLADIDPLKSCVAWTGVGDSFLTYQAPTVSYFAAGSHSIGPYILPNGARRIVIYSTGTGTITDWSAWMTMVAK